MSTKNNPGLIDCYARALPDEPMFILLARDPQFAALVERWANERERRIDCGDAPALDELLVTEANSTAYAGSLWRKQNNGIWRK